MFETIDVTSGLVTVSGATVTIDPAGTLASSTGYYVEIAAGTVKDLSNNNFAGIAGNSTWNFTTADVAAPTVTSLNPADDATGVAVGANLVVTFSENVQKGTGNILIRRSADNTVFETIDVTSGLVTVSGATVTIDPAGTLASSTGYYVEIAAGAVKDLSNNNFAGIAGNTAWNFTTADVAAPTVTALNPADDATGVAVGANLVVTFSETVQKGTGNILIRRSADNAVFETIDVTSGLVTVSGATVTIDPAGTLASSTGYYVELAAGAVKDLSNNNFAGIAGNSTWNFTTADVVNENFTTELRLDGSGNLVVTDIASGGQHDTLTIKSDTTNSRFIISDPNRVLGVAGTITGAVVSGDSHTVTVPFSSVPGNMWVNTRGGNDSLTVDFSAGNFGKTVTYDGGGDNNVLNITGNPGPVEIEQYDAVTRTITFDPNTTVSGDEESIVFANVSAIQDDRPVAGMFRILGTPQADTIDIGAGTVGTLVALGGGATPIDFANKSHTRIQSLAGDDTFRIAAGTTLAGSIDGGLGSDTLDYSVYASGATVTVDLADASPGAGYLGTATAISVGIVAGVGMVDPGDPAVNDLGSSIENVYGGAGNDTLTGDLDDNLLRDGAGHDVLSGGDGNDTFQLQPGGGSSDYLLDDGAGTGDWVDFSLAQFTNPATAGVTFDLDLVGRDADGSIDVNDPAGSIDQPAPQVVYEGNQVSLLYVGPAQTPPPDSPFENFRGSDRFDEIQIDFIEDVIREVDGGPGGGEMTFGGGGSELIDSGRSVTAAGIGSIVYANMIVDPVDVAPRIIDNDDLGFRTTAGWGRTTSEGYRGDERFAAAGVGDQAATWSFFGVTPGWYRVAATWLAGANRATNAQFQVLNGDLPALASPTGDLGNLSFGPGVINQRTAPAGFQDAGTAWQELTDAGNPAEELFFWITGHTLAVTLVNSGNAFVMADAVRIERIDATTAEIRVLEGDGRRDVISGRWLTDFGTSDTEISVERTFLVQNTGLAPLTVTAGTASLPAEYSVVPGTFTLLPGQEQAVAVTLQSASSGTFAGTLSLAAVDDRDENPFLIDLTGLVRSATTADPNALVLDNNDAATATTEFSTNGNFRYIRRDTRYVDDDYLYARNSGAGPPGRSAA